MKRTLHIALLCAVLVFSCLFTGCKPTALKKEDGGFRNPKTDIFYSPAEPSYRAQPLTGDAYARITVRKGADDVLLYAIEGLDPERYLVSDSYTVYCAEGAELPTLFDFPCARVGIYDTQVASNDGNVTDAREIDLLKDLHKNGVSTSLTNVAAYFEITPTLIADWYDLRFMGSGEYAGIYYQLKYVVCSEDVIITEWIEDPNDFTDFYPGVPFETEWRTYSGEDYFMADYNFGKELLVDDTTGKCYMLDSSLLPYITPAQ